MPPAPPTSPGGVGPGPPGGCRRSVRERRDHRGVPPPPRRPQRPLARAQPPSSTVCNNGMVPRVGKRFVSPPSYDALGLKPSHSPLRAKLPQPHPPVSRRLYAVQRVGNRPAFPFMKALTPPTPSPRRHVHNPLTLTSPHSAPNQPPSPFRGDQNPSAPLSPPPV